MQKIIDYCEDKGYTLHIFRFFWTEMREIIVRYKYEKYLQWCENVWLPKWREKHGDRLGLDYFMWGYHIPGGMKFVYRDENNWPTPWPGKHVVWYKRNTWRPPTLGGKGGWYENKHPWWKF